jgi:hypothetical protein
MATTALLLNNTQISEKYFDHVLFFHHFLPDHFIVPYLLPDHFNRFITVEPYGQQSEQQPTIVSGILEGAEEAFKTLDGIYINKPLY